MHQKLLIVIMLYLISIPISNAQPDEFSEKNAYEHIRVLSEEIGHRVAGSENGIQASNYIETKFNEYKLDVYTQEFEFNKYIRIGQYYEDNGDLTSDPVIAIDYNYGKWIPIRIERVIVNTVYSHIENGKRVMYPDKIEEFMLIQRMLAQKIREQGWLDSGIKLKRK